jgi:hypothetical protein
MVLSGALTDSMKYNWNEFFTKEQMEELKEKGFSFNMDTAAYNDDEKLKNIYLAGEFGGFAIHIMQR